MCIQSLAPARYCVRCIICEDWAARILYCSSDRNSMLVAANALIDFTYGIFQVLVTHRHKITKYRIQVYIILLHKIFKM